MNELITIVNQIPSGKVVSYGQVAEQLCIQCGINTSGRLVGRMLSSLPKQNRDICSWQRVINKQGVISTLKLGEKGLVQIELLKGEGVEVYNGVVDMKKYCWKFPS